MFGKRRSDTIRSRVTLDEINGLEITIPAERNRWFIGFGGVWLIGWAFGEVMVAGWLVAMALGFPVGQGHVHGASMSPAAFMILWLAGWTVGGVIMMHAYIWQLRGRAAVRDPRSTE
jgi:hypothetical protein